MDLEATVAAPFQRAGRTSVPEGQFVVALSLDRDWFSPDQAKRVVDLAVADGLLRREDGDLAAEFDPSSVSVPADERPGEEVLRKRSPFERVLSALVAEGADKRETVAAINRLQNRLGITVEAAAVLYARRQGNAVTGPASAARDAITAEREDSSPPE